MEEAVRRAIARIDVIDGTAVLSRGTGFLVGRGLVLTALHVVANRHQDPPQFLPGRIVLTFPGASREARIHPSFWDRRADWALLTCEELEGVRPLPMADLERSGDTWETYGFPDANPRDGMVQRGTVENHLGDLEGVPAFQLFSRQAAAGHGAPVKGLSGGPVLIDGALVGLLRFALMKDGQAVAGTLYACPVAAPLAKTGDLFPVPDPCHGLPGLKRRPLPAKPFRYLDRFTASDAEVFFGRNREIRELYLRLTAAGSSPIVLLYGQSGVGKSSFLDAGLLPRLEWHHEVRYVRRDAHRSLTATLLAAVRPADAAEATPLPAAWRLAEDQENRPLIVILDQLEEVYTRPAARDPEELTELFAVLVELFGDPVRRPQGRLVLGFRKEWFPEVQKQFEVHGLDYAKVFLEGLDRAAILEVATGLTLTPRLRERYGLEVEPGLAQVIAGDLLADRDSPIAPTLQILLTRMWQEATAESQRAPRFTDSLYARLRDEGYLLGDFLDQQLQKLGRGAMSPAEAERLGEFLDRQLERLGNAHGLEGWSERPAEERAEVVESGLVLDVLAYHTTPLLTAEQRTESDLRERYRHRAGVLADLVQALKSLFLLTDPAGDSAQAAAGTRLGHDTLAPLVRQRYDLSMWPGQRARRILESRASDWRGERTQGPAPLDAWDLKVVEAGLPGMRSLQPQEERLLAASRQERRRRRRNLWLLRAAGLAVLAGLGVILWLAWRVEERHRLFATSQEVQRLLAVEPVAGLIEAIAATGDSLDHFGQVFAPVQFSLLRAVEEARERNRFVHGTAVSSVAASPDGRMVASAGEDGAIRLWSLKGEAPRVLPKTGTVPRAIAFSRDGLLASVGDDGKLRLWSATDGTLRALSQQGHTGVAWTVAFSPDGKLAATGGDDRLVRLWDLEGRSVGAPFQGHSGAVHEVVFSPDGSMIASASQDATVRLWDLQGRSVAEPYRGHSGPVYAVAFSPSGKSLASGGEEGSLRQWTPDGKDAYPPLRRHEGAVTALVFLDGNTLVSASEDQTVLFQDRDGHRLFAPFIGFQDTVPTMAAVPGRHELVAGSDDKSVRILDLEHSQLGPPLVSEPGGGGIRRLAFAAGDRLLALGSALWVFDTKRSDHPKLLTLPDVTAGSVSALALSPGGQRLAAGSVDGSIQLWDAGGRRLGPPLAEGNGQPILALRFSRGRLLSSDANATVIVREADGRVLHRFSGNRQLSAAAFRADGEHVAAVTDDGTVLLWDAAGKALRDPLRSGTVRTVALAWNPVAPYLASGDADGYLTIWDLDSGQKACRKKAHNFEVSSLDWSPEGDSLISSGSDRSVRLWDLQCSKLGELNGHFKSVAAVAFSDVGEIAASTGRDGTLRLWRADWHDWLKLGCERLSQHPVFTHPADDRSRRAREVCQSLVRLEKKRQHP